MLANNVSSGAGSKPSWVYASPPRENGTPAREGTRASKECAASRGKYLFSYPTSEPNADVPGPGFIKKRLQQENDHDKKKYLKVSPLKILPLPAVAQFKDWKRHFDAEVSGAPRTAD